MTISACLKVSVGNREPKIFSFQNYDFQPFIQTNPTLDEKELAVSILMERVFLGFGSQSGILFSGEVTPSSNIYGGGLFNKFTLDGMEDRVTFAGFSEHRIKSLLLDMMTFVDIDGNEIPPQGLSMDSTIDEFEEFINIGTPVEINIQEGNSDIRIYKMSSAEIVALELGTPYSYEDCFEYLKDSVDYSTAVLDSEGYKKSQYSSSGDYVEIKSNYSIVQQEMVCTPTELRFTPNVTIPSGKDKVLLRFRLEDANGFSIKNFNGETEFVENVFYKDEFDRDGDGFLENDAEDIAQYLFLYSGVDMMRQMDVGDYFGYTPYSLDGLSEIHIYGYDSNGTNAREDKQFFQGEYKLILQTIPNLPSDSVDFVKEQFGGEVEIYSCGAAFNTGV